jgi:hypothetical protein
MLGDWYVCSQSRTVNALWRPILDGSIPLPLFLVHQPRLALCARLHTYILHRYETSTAGLNPGGTVALTAVGSRNSLFDFFPHEPSTCDSNAQIYRSRILKRISFLLQPSYLRSNYVDHGFWDYFGINSTKFTIQRPELSIRAPAASTLLRLH